MVTPLGNDAESSWDNLVAGESGGTDHALRHGGLRRALRLRAEGLRSETWMDRKRARRMDRFSQLALSANNEVSFGRRGRYAMGASASTIGSACSASIRCAEVWFRL